MLFLVTLMLFGLVACTSSAPPPSAQSSSAATSSSGSAMAPTTSSSGSPAASGAPVWPTDQKAAPLNTCLQCQCPQLLDDSKYTSQVIFDNNRGFRYSEAFITCPDGRIGIFNTTGLNIRPANSRDSIPAADFKGYSDSAVEQEYGAKHVFMEEIRFWLMDRLRVQMGNNFRNLSGLDTRFGALSSASAEDTRFTKIATVTRDSTFYFNKGQPLFILDAPKSEEFPEGVSLIQQSWVEGAGPFQDPAIQSKLTLPEGWKWRTITAPKDLTINGLTENGKTNQWKVIQDNLGDSYSACWTTGGQSSCNYQP